MIVRYRHHCAGGGTADRCFDFLDANRKGAYEHQFIDRYLNTALAPYKLQIRSELIGPVGGELGSPIGALGVGGVSAPREFTAPGLDSGLIVSTSLALKTVNYQ